MPFSSAAGLWLKRYRRMSIKIPLSEKWTALCQISSPMPRKNDRIDTIPIVLLHPINKPMSKESDLKEHYSDMTKILFRNT